MNNEENNGNILSTMEEVIGSMSEEIQENETHVNGENSTQPENTGSEEHKFSVDDALIERGVKAGLSIATVKGFTSAEMADQILTALESKSSSEASPSGQQANGDDTPAIDLTDFTEENGYEPSLVKVLSSMKTVIEEQQKTIKALKAAGVSAAGDSFFTEQFNGLDDGLKSHVDAVKKSQLKAKFDFLEKAYKSSGTKLSREEIFKEAKTLVLGDLAQKIATDDKDLAIRKRATLKLAPAGGQPVNKKSSQEEKEDSILEDLRDKFKLG